MILLTVAEILLDGILIFLASFGIFNERSRLKVRDSLLVLSFSLFCCVSRVSILADADTSILSIGKHGYEIVPASDLFLFLFLILTVLVTNSLWFRKNATYTFFGTLAVFTVIIVAREIFIILLYGLGTSNNDWKSLLCRVCSMLLLGAVLCTPFFKWLRDKLDDNSFPVKLLIGNTTVLLCALIVFLDFDVTKTADNLLIITGTIAVLSIVNLLVGIYTQKHSAEMKRISMLEQYIPVIEELITQVRARQHQFNNRLLAISAAAQTASNLEEAKTEISKLSNGLNLELSEQSLLNCDGKIVAGMIFSKIKYAEMKKITVIVEITASLKNMPKVIQELDVVEIIGILMDNAIEASNADDTVYVKIERLDEGLLISVSNPHEMLSNIDFVQMFRRGFSTKVDNDGAHGHGLANAKEIAIRNRGKVVTRNETKHEKNYITIGILFP